MSEPTAQRWPPGPPSPPAPQPPRPSRPSGRGRRWWRAVGSVVAVVVLLSALLQVVGLLGRSTETVRRTLDLDGVLTLVVDSPDGDVSVAGARRSDARVVAHLEHGLWPSRLRVERRGDELVVRSWCPPVAGWCSARLSVEVPAGLPVVVRSGNGEVVARDLAAPARLRSSNGNVRAVGLGGPAHLSSANGDVTATALGGTRVVATSRNGDVSVDAATPPELLVAESSNGDAEVVVPDDGEPYRLEMSTANGNRTGDVRSDPDSDRRLRITSRNGDVSVRDRAP